MSTVAELEQQKVDFNAAIEKRKVLQRLMNNRDFKKLILEDFCVQECARYAQASADPNLSANERADALALAQSAGHIRRYLNVLDIMGNAAENQMQRLDDAIEDARLDEANVETAPYAEEEEA
jgi:replication-associated recombination protein RarA